MYIYNSRYIKTFKRVVPAGKTGTAARFPCFIRQRKERNEMENKEFILSLYNALNGTDYTDTTLLDITTIQDVIYMGMKNDSAFIIDSELNLFE